MIAPNLPRAFRARKLDEVSGIAADARASLFACQELRGGDVEDLGTHSLRRTKASTIYKATGNIRTIQILPGHSKIENTVRYLGVDIEDAPALAEKTEIRLLWGASLFPAGVRYWVESSRSVPSTSKSWSLHPGAPPTA
jgi:integrase